MSWCDHLEFNVAHTGHARLRDLCDDSHPEHARHRAAQARIRAALTRGAAPPPDAQSIEPKPELLARIALLSEAAQCPHRAPGAAACGCSHKARCSKYNEDVTLEECGACVAAGRNS